MRDRFASGFDPFVIPFVLGMLFVLSYCICGIFRIYYQLPFEDRKKFLKSLITPKTAWKNIQDIFLNCLIHVKLWKRNKVLGYMHSSIAFGWFMLILLGHIEVMLFVPQRIRFFYYPIFFNYFVAESESTIKGAFWFFLMDFFLLVVLSGIIIAIIKRFRSQVVGMRRTTSPSFLDLIGTVTLWAIFPLRLLAEGFTAHISGGSFLTVPLNWIFRQFFGNDLNMLPTWWVYSLVLCVFLCVLPFTRYMHIPAEMMLIPMRNAGLKIRHARRGFARAEVYSCPNCGVCIDACPMSVKKCNIKDCTVYLNRQIRRNNERRIEQISDKCLLCGKCAQVCQVGCEGHTIRIAERATRRYGFNQNYGNIDVWPIIQSVMDQGKVMYFAGCMTQLTPRIKKAMESVLKKAGVNYVFMDRDGGICCGRPMLTAGRFSQAKQLIQKNESIIMGSGVKTLVLSCPICYKIFREHYNLPGIRIVHHSEYLLELANSGALKIQSSEVAYAYHDPCELGRGCGVYDQPRRLLSMAGHPVDALHSRAESICCGGSLGSLTLSHMDREAITLASLKDLTDPLDRLEEKGCVATACPLCLSTFSRYADRPVMDLSEIVDKCS